MKRILLIATLSIIILIAIAIILGSFFTTPSASIFNFSNKIAVIPIKGDIMSESPAFSATFSAEEIVERIDMANADPTVGAVLFDIDSPGGSIVSTKQIVYKIRSLEKPSVAYIGEMGASGAYYVAAATDYIVADDDSITGSIGVISIVPNIEGLLEKLGINVKVLKEGEFKSMADPFHELTEEEEEILQTILKEAFEAFKADILEFRGDKLDESSFNEIADGRILSGRQALEANLIDMTGTKEDAINKAAELAGIEGKSILKYYPKKEFTFFDLFTISGYAFASGLKDALSPKVTVVKA